MKPNSFWLLFWLVGVGTSQPALSAQSPAYPASRQSRWSAGGGTAAPVSVSTQTSILQMEARPMRPDFLFSAPGPVRLRHSLRFIQRVASPVELRLEIRAEEGRVVDRARQTLLSVAPGISLLVDHRLLVRLSPGFYEASLEARASGRRLGRLRYGFGYAAEKIHPPVRRPKDFHRFWADTLNELSGIPLEPRVEPSSAESGGGVECSKVSYSSLNRTRVHAWYCRPVSGGPFPGILISPWYSQGAIPAPKEMARRGLAVLWYQGRGFEVDQSSYPLENQWYILSGIESPLTYVYRGMIAHAVRGIAFLTSRPEVDRNRIGVGGASQGGGLSLILAGLDRRVSAAAADFPFLCDIRDSLNVALSPYRDIREFIQKNPKKRDAVLSTLNYFDAIHFSDRIHVPVFVEAGLRDHTCPAAGILEVYRRLPGRRKTLKLYPAADHSDEGEERWRAMTDFLVQQLGR